MELPDGVVSEILLDTTMSLFGTVNMRLPFLPLIGATDASTVFGLGGTVARLEPDQVRDIAHLACKRGGHATLSDGPELSDALLASWVSVTVLVWSSAISMSFSRFGLLSRAISILRKLVLWCFMSSGFFAARNVSVTGLSY